MALPSRTTFLSLGLVPVAATTPLEDCGICIDTPTPAVQTPCTHIFCKACITTWLTKQGKNTCPMCRVELFSLSDTETMHIPAARRALAAQALRTSPLRQVAMGTVDNFRAPGLHPARPNVQRATASALEFLAAGPRTVRPGSALLETKDLAAHVLAMGHLIPEYAEARGRQYLATERECWAEIVRAVWLAIKCFEGTHDALTLPAEMLALTARDRDMNPFGYMLPFFRSLSGPSDNSYSGDVVLLISYVIAMAKVRHARRAAERETRGDRPCAVM